MTKSVSLLILFVMVFSLSACGASKADIKKADDFITSLSSFESTDPVNDIDELVDASAAVINLPDKAFEFKDGWEKKKDEHEKYFYIFNTDATLSVYTGSGKVKRVTYTFCVDSAKDMYGAADNLIGIYGEPASVYLNGAASSHGDVDRATNNSEDPELTYSYAWKTELQGQSIYVYEAYYNASGVNFSYVIVSNFLNIADPSQNKFWN